MAHKCPAGFGLPVPHLPSEPGRPRASSVGHRPILPPIRRGSVTEQRGLYSDTICPLRVLPCIEGPGRQNVPVEKSCLEFSNVTTDGTSGSCKLVKKDQPLPRTTQNVYFAKGADAPKVRMPYKHVPGHIPRKLAVERLRREYLSLDLEQLLADKGVDSNLLMTRGLNSEHTGSAMSPYLPLELFDNEDYDCRTPEDWLALGNAEGSPHRMPIPAKALLLRDEGTTSNDARSPSMDYSWHLVGVLDYCKGKGLFLVQKVHQDSQQTDNKGNPTEGTDSFVGGSEHWVPRIRLCFSAEDPRVFVERIQSARLRRQNAEALVCYHLYVDCMTIPPGTPSLSPDSLQRIKSAVLSTPRLRPQISKRCMESLEEEVKLDHVCAENRMRFDRAVMSHPEEFPHITLPQKDFTSGPQQGCVPVVYSTFEENRKAIFFHSFLTKPVVFTTLSEVLFETSEMAHMKLFNVTLKPMRLEEFEWAQSTIHTKIHLFLKQTFMDKLANSIRCNLLTMGKGAFNVNVSCWDVYKLSKLSKLMTLVRLNVQDSLRSLVLDSLASLTQLVLDACHSLLACPQDVVWGNDLNTSPYKPKRNPLFLVDLVLDKTGVHYSTPLENFESSIVNLFDGGVLATHKLTQLDKLVTPNLFRCDGELLETVNLWEPDVTEMREKVRSALIQAVIPLRAYAAEYEKHLELYNLDIETLLKSHTADQTAQEVKEEVEQHLEDGETIKRSLPSSIVIGPFTVCVEAVQQSLTKKRKALAEGLLSQLAVRLRQQLDNACEECHTISRKLLEKPNSIEELAENREWMKQIPNQLKSFRDAVGKIMTDYEIMDGFFYPLSDEDANKKWTAIGWPQKILVQMEKVVAQHVEDEQHFRKILLADQNTFEEHLDSLQMLVVGFASHTDIDHATEISNKVRLTSKQLKECQTLAQTYNTRERLFGLPITHYDRVQKLMKDLQPFEDLWKTTSDWQDWHESWLNDPLTSIDPEQLERHVTEALKTMHKCFKNLKDLPDCQRVAAVIRSKIEDFCPYIPVIQGLRNPGMRSRHWEMLSERIQLKVTLKANLTFSHCLELGLQNHVNEITHVAEVAGKEYAIKQALEKMEKEWSEVVFDVLPYKDTGTYILKSPDEASQLLDDHIVMTQNMSFSPFKKEFEAHINTWERKLKLTQDVLEEWLMCQRSWLYLQPIFSSDDINQQLPAEGKRYQIMEQTWRDVMRKAFNNPKVIELCPVADLLKRLQRCNAILEKVQKGLSEYLETKRGSFPRFYFLSDDELLEILSQTTDPTAVQPHLRKCFENIAQLRFQSDLQITHMYSGEGEEVELLSPVCPTGNVEDWLKEVEKSMKATLRDNIDRSLKVYPEQPRAEWVLSWPGQVVIAGCQVFWTVEVSEALEHGDLESRLYPQLQTQLGDLVELVRGRLSKVQRAVLSALIVIQVHAKDVAAKLVEQSVSSVNDFEWISQLRYYWMKNDLYIRAVNAEFLYGYEYLGNSGRLVITPLTDRCYLTLIGALHLKFGGAPAGPAGTGKTETTKDLGKALAIQTVVFNCSDQLDFIAMGKFLKGLACSGAWACFDEFNRIDVEVLSVVAQQITTIQKAQQQRAERFVFEGAEIPLVPSCAVFITMNPGYAGRTELPDNLKALFRPVAMMVPDYAMIAEISLYSFGFSDAKVLSKKITTTFKLSSEQLSSQDHYDFGMRAVKTVISAAGNLKRENPTMDEELICLRAIQDVNVPKFLLDDLKLFNGIVSDLFPKTKQEPISYGVLEESMRAVCTQKNLKDVDGYINKCIQLYETTVVRHGLMLVGPSGSGKTKCYEILGAALTALKGQPSVSGGVYETVQTHVLNPKSITMGQLYGEYDLDTHEWTDGILSSLIRGGAASMDTVKKWYMFDGPVDAVWIENMNTVLDDNKKLCLSSGEIIKLTDVMTMMFEVQDLAVASPATVSRCGMVYLEPSILGLAPFTECWLKQVPEGLKPHTEQLKLLFARFLQDSITFLHTSVKEVIASLDSNLTCSLLKLMDCFFSPFIAKEGGPAVPQKKVERVAELIEPWFIFSLVWSVGATGDAASCQRFSGWLKNKMSEEKIKLCFPEEGSVYDYRLDDAGISNPEEDNENEARKVQWVSWMKDAKSVVITPETNYDDITVPIVETVRMSFLIDMLLTNKKPVLCIGPSGTGKTLTISDKLLKNMPGEYITHFLMFSARTSANQTQDYIDSKLDKKRKGVFGPPVGKHFIFFIDDLNMPMLETYGAQPPIELLRQFMDHGGWYDRKQIGAFKHLVDINLACAMGPPGGGRNPITQRFTRHFNFLSFTEMEDSSKKTIFSTILGSWMRPVPSIQPLNESLVDATIRVYSTITSQLLPTPAKSHYTFNLTDLSKVFQGILMAEAGMVEDKVQLLKLWYHESCRVFQDRLVCAEDRDWFNKLLRDRIQEFDCCFEEVVPSHPVLYGDFMVPGADPKVYTHIEDKEKLAAVMEAYMEDYNETSMTKMKLVLFMDAIEHVCRISRILRQPLGNALLLGVGGSGRQSLTKLASHMSEYECFQIELSKNYGQTEWKEDIKGIMLKAGIQNQPITFLFVDTQIKSESFLEDINNILNSGDVPNLYAADEQERILTEMKPVVQDLGQQPTKTNLMAAYIRRVRRNIHTVLCMSPIGEVFRARLRQFPSLLTCCTIDWFSAWPEEALQAVATSFLNDMPELEASPTAVEGLAQMCVRIHEMVARKCQQYLAELSRHNYVTPKSYLELLKIFSDLTGRKKQELCGARKRMKTGLDKLLKTAEDVSKMQKELETMRPLLEEAAQDTEVTMETIKKDTVVAEETRKSVQAEEAKASEKARFAGDIAADAQRDLDEALPALDAALDSLKSLNKNDITEVRAMQRPPQGVKLVIEAVCIMKGIKPKKVPGEQPGTKIDDYWTPGKALLQDPGKFLESLFKYDKDNIPDNVINLVQPYIDNEEFQPDSIAKVSKACTSICQWVRAMYVYHFVAKAVEPKRQALKEAQEDLAATQRILDDANEKLAAVESGIATLQAKYQDCLAKKDELDKKYQQCEARLIRADKLIGGLADEKVRWKETVQHLDYMVNNVAGDVLLSAGYIAYLGPFTGEYRAAMAEEWLHCFKELSVPHTEEPNLINTLGDPVKIRSWQISGLPKDNLSVENGVIAQYSLRWALFIDPQGQANTWIKHMERDNMLKVMKLSDQDFLRSLEHAISFGNPCLLENVGEELNPVLEPVLLKQTFKREGSTMLKLGDAVIFYHEDFKLYITTKLPNPHYSPEVSTKVTLINFTLSPSGLEDQLLGQVVAEERLDLEEAKNQLIISNARMKQELKEIEDEILFRLSSTEGNPVDNQELIQVLEASKIKAAEIQAKVIAAEKTEQDIDATRLQYVPVAVRAQILFFCVSDLSNVDPMYQYSLEWFLGIFLAGIANSEAADTVEKRVSSINEFFTFSLYSNVCRSLFEKHKLMFAFLLCARIMMNENKIDMAEWRYLLSGGMPVGELSNPADSWLSQRAWQDILGLSSLDNYSGLAESFSAHLQGFKRIFDSNQPHREPLPGEWDTMLDPFQKLLVLRCLRADCLIQGLQDFVSTQLGQRFIEPQTSDLSVVFRESSFSTPLIFVLSPGTDPAADVYKFADVKQFSKKMSAISLGQGQGPLAEATMQSAMERGHWVFFQNCHLAPSWMPSLERLIENIDPAKVHKDFRLWLTSLPSNKFPVSILQNGSKMTIEPPRGIKANLQKTYLRLTSDFITCCNKTAHFKSLLLSLCLFHGIALERRKFGPLGFNIPYEFTDGDLNICMSQLKMFLDEYQDVPYKVLKYTAGQINYGGRVTDDWDRRCLLSVLEDFYCPAVLTPDHVYSSAGVYRQIDTDLDLKGYLAYIRGLPINDTPEIFGLHDNANISFAQNETFALLGAVFRLQPRAASAGGRTLEEIVEEIVLGIVEKIPQPFSVEEVMEKYPVLYEESMNTVLIQEVVRYNKLLTTISQSLSDIVKALKGLVVMSAELELMSHSLFNNVVPDMWKTKAYPSLKPLASWVSDLLQRISFLQKWISDGIPPVFWISGFFFPQAFLTGTLQNYARRSGISIETIGFDFKVKVESVWEITELPDSGCYIHGLFLEGASWDNKAGQLAESRPKELHTQMAVIWLIPKPNRKPPTSGVYVCPIYKTLTRAGIMLKAGIQNQPITFLFVDTQIKSESFLEDINNILNSGDVPNLYAADEQERILTEMKPVVQDLGQQPTKTNLMAAYIRRVRRNIHTVLCMSPIGEVFRARLRQFPSLLTCCTIDWFSAWPEEALQAVATSFLNDMPELEASPTAVEGLAQMCVRIHEMVARKCQQYLAELSRHNYVTPKSYLELLKIFSDLTGRKKQELCGARKRMKTGLDKLLKTAEDVSKMQKELETMRPLLEEAAQDTEVTMETIKKDTVVAEETRKSVQAEEAKASEKARFAGDIAADAQRDLDEALPALDAALDSLKSLNKNDITEVRAMQRPPQGVKLVIEAVCIMKGIKPKKVPGEQPGTKIDDYWTPGKALLQDPGKFLESLFKYDKDNIPDNVINLVQPYIDNEEFQPDSIAKVSKACTSICQWVRAMYVYHFVAKAVEPKRQALKEAQEDLAATQRILDDANEKLAAVESGIATLQAKYQDCLAKKDELDKKYQQCEARLIRADKLIGGLADEKVRWKETVQHLDYMVNNVAGDVLLSAGYIAYLGPFTGEYRAAMAEEWLHCFKELSVPHTEEPNLINTLGDLVKIRSWQISGLPKDNLSVENGVIAQYSLRWALFIDPQGQANTWIKHMERDNMLKVMKLSDQDFLRSLEHAISFGNPCLLENVGEELNPVLEPVLLKQTFKREGSTMLKLGDAVIFYHEDFKLYITTKLPNPHYSPEVSTKVTLINFTLSPSGLEDQLLGQVVAEERLDLEEAKNQLIISNARMKQELKEIEDEILFRLSSTEGNPVDNQELIQVLEASKIKAAEIQAKVIAAEKTEQDIDATRLQYVPVAVRAQILFFCVSDLSNVDPMYQYSLEWFLGIFLAGIANSEAADTVEKRVSSINEFFTFSLYSNVCRSLFEKHKLMFAFLLCARIMMNENKIDMAEWRYLLSGGMPVGELSNPADSWLSQRTWQDILGLSSLDNYSGLAESFSAHLQGFKRIFDSNQPHREPLPGEWDTMLDPFQKLLVLRCLRADCLIQGLQDFVSTQLGQRFIEPQTSDLSVVFRESSFSTPLIFVLSPGTDPAADVYKFADVKQFSKKMSAISLGQGQGPLAEATMQSAMERGHWVFFQNCHLAPSWMPSLERLIENIDPAKVHKDFRLWLTSLPSNKFPVSILQNGSKMTIEPPRGIKANLQKTYLRLTSDFITCCNKTAHFKSLLLSLCLFHGIALERRKFGPLGFNIPYEFTDGDLNICMSQLKMFLDEYQDVPYKVLKYTAGQINYGGRVTDDWDRRCLLSVLEDFYCPAVLTPDHVYSSAGVYRQIDTDLDLKGYLAYIRGLPINDTPEIFGLHDNANISFAQNETFALLGAVVRLQPRAASAGGRTLEEIVEEIVLGIVEKIPQPFSVEEVMEKYPVLYEESMNTVLIQEVVRYNKLLTTISQSLSDIVKALKGLVVMSAELELMSHSLFNNVVPDMWKTKAYPSLKPLASWVSDLLQRISFLQKWISDGIPPVFWISGFFFPQAFLTGTLQNYARRSGISIETIGFDFKVKVESVWEITELPDSGCYIHGLFLEGASWDNKAGQLAESRPKELHTQMAVIWLIPKPNRKPPTSGVYVCPIYKTLTRAGTLSTTGHSTNYVMAVELPTDRSQRHWVKRGVALICALDY